MVERKKNNLGLDFPNIPYLFDGRVVITQSQAILRHIGRLNDLLGETEEEQSRVDMVIDQTNDLKKIVSGLVYSPDFFTKRDCCIKDEICPMVDQFANYLGDDKWFGKGSNPTIADFPIYELFDQLRTLDPYLFYHHENLRCFMDRFEALPAIRDYINSARFMSRPFNGKMALFK